MTREASPTVETPTEAGPKRGAGRGIALAVFWSMTLVGALILIGGLAVIGAHTFVRDGNGFYNTGTERLETASAALLSEDIDLTDRAADWAPDDVLGDLRFQAEAIDGSPVFLGIADAADLDRYLDGVAHAEVTRFGDNPRYDEQPGAARAARPGAQQFWAAQAEGAGEQSVEWQADNGNWTAVAMNPDGTAGLALDAKTGVEIGWLIWLGLGLAVVGLVVAAGGIALIVHTRRQG